MTPARLETIEEIFHSALAQAPNQISSFLDTTCQGDAALRSKLEMLLASHSRAGGFMETPAVELATKILHAQPASLAGQRIGHYELSERIGAGGMGEVYLATDVIAGRKAALKLLLPRFTGDAQRLKRFAREARALAGLNHPNILTVYEIGEERSTHFIASELVDGETVRQRLERGRMGQEEALDLAIQVTHALTAAHEAGIVHRDIKPENIMLRRDGYLKVLDFGIAKLAEPDLGGAMAQEDPISLAGTHVGSILGTVRYMSPEQAAGGALDQRTDIWSLGAVLYEMLAGRAPFSGDTPGDVITFILEREPPPLTNSSVPDELQQIISKTLRKNPEERYQSARELSGALKHVRRGIDLSTESQRFSAPPSGMRLVRTPTALAALGVIAALALALPGYWHRNATTNPTPPKSIAVLPFENLGADKENSFFAAGVQDEILSDLAKLADLKVISRTSANAYAAGQPRNSRQIGQQLGVAHLLEGNVQRIGNRVRINAQLIDARTDSHLWAQVYDRDLSDVFAIQSEIAQTIANQLQAKISEREKAAMAQPTTNALVANDLYLQAVALESDDQSRLKAEHLLQQAIARDPHFLRAYCLLGRIDVSLYEGDDHTAARLQSAKAAIDQAAQLQPDAGEVHLVRAWYLARGLRQYDNARAELELARRTLPNDPAVYAETALMDRRQGRWAEALQNFDRAIELDPRNLKCLTTAADARSQMGRYAEATQLGHRALALAPHDTWTRLFIASQPLDERADILPLRSELNAILAEDPGALSAMFASFWDCAVRERDSAAADRALAVIPRDGFRVFYGSILPREWFVGCTARIFDRPEMAAAAFAAARVIVEKHLKEQPDDALGWILLGKIKAALGEKEEAIEAGRRACQIWPLSSEGLWGQQAIKGLTIIYAWTGETTFAMEQLNLYARQPGFINYGDLKLDPYWDPLRGDPRFEKIVAALAKRQH